MSPSVLASAVFAVGAISLELSSTLHHLAEIILHIAHELRSAVGLDSRLADLASSPPHALVRGDALVELLLELFASFSMLFALHLSVDERSAIFLIELVSWPVACRLFVAWSSTILFELVEQLVALCIDRSRIA